MVNLNIIHQLQDIQKTLTIARVQIGRQTKIMIIFQFGLKALKNNVQHGYT